MSDSNSFQSIRVVIVDDQPVVRQGFELFLSTSPGLEVVGHADNGQKAVDVVREMRPDVVLLDIRMPSRNGLWAAREILAAPKPPKIIVVTTFDLDEYVFKAMDLGASGFLLKDTEPRDLVAAVRQVAAGGVALSPRITPRVVAEFARRRPDVTPAPPPEDHGLSVREAEVVDLLTQGMTNDEIASRLQLESSTIKTHISNICRKVGVKSRLQVVVWAYRNGVAKMKADLDIGPAGSDH